MKYIVFGPDMADEEFDKKQEEDNKKLDEWEQAYEKLIKEIKELLEKRSR